ncbi:MAG: hypothetical protein E7527_01095 [Ruminococcaceae bacterium]|nr:hypothetical protein [Oscillospiraceae bacterium]
MRQKLSISRLLRNDKLMMLVSLISAVVIWALVVYGPGNIEDRTISGVPIPVSLAEDIAGTYDLYIVKVNKETATVKVNGTRGEIGRLSPQDIQIAVDTSGITKAGQYNLRYRVVSSGDYDVKIVGDDTVTVVCDEFDEKAFDVSVDISNLTMSDPQKHQPYIPVFNDSSVEDNKIKVKGPKSAVKNIARVVATIPDKAVLSEQATFEAELVAYDKNDKPVESIEFLTIIENKVKVNVPILNRYKVQIDEGQIKPEMLNNPKGYVSDDLSMYTLKPSAFEFWCLPNKYEKVLAEINNQLHFDFDLLTPDKLTREVVLTRVQEGGEDGVRIAGGTEVINGVRLDNDVETLKVSLNLGKVTTKTFKSIALSKENFKVTNLPEGYTCSFMSDKLTNIVLCGPTDALKKIKPEDLILKADLTGKTEGAQTVVFQLVTNNDKVWVCYSNDAANPKSGVDITVKITKETEKTKEIS